MANVQTTTTSVTNHILAKSIEQSVRENLRAIAFLPKLIRQFSLAGKNSKVFSFTEWQSVTAAGVAEGTALESVQQQLNNFDITVSEVGISIEPTDLSVETSNIDVSEYGMRGAIAISQKMESDIAALFAAASNTVGTTAQELTLDTILAAVQKAEELNNFDQKVLVVHPRQTGAIRRAMLSGTGSILSRPDLVDPTVKDHYVGHLFNLPIFQTTLVPKVNTNADYAGCLFSVEAFGMAMLRDVRVEPERSAKARATAMVATSAYGVGSLGSDRSVRVISKVA